MRTNHQNLPAILALAVALCLSTPAIFAQDNVLSYQGRVQSSGTNVTGPGLFKFALVTVSNSVSTATGNAVITFGSLALISITDGGSGYTSAPAVTITGGGGTGATAAAIVSAGSVVAFTVTSPGSGYTSTPTVTVAPPPPILSYVTHWSNDGSSTAGGEPTQAVPVQVNKGLFTVRLGDASLSNMLNFPVGLFEQPSLQLRTWFNDGVHGFVPILPTHRLTAVAYAFTANSASVADYATAAGSVSGPVPAAQITGLIGTDQLASGAVTSGKILDGGISAEDLGPTLRNNTFWRLDGNADTVGNVNFVGTTDDKPLDLRANNMRGLRLQANSNTVHVIGGWSGNNVAADMMGATISGGGAPEYTNRVAADFGTIGGGGGNLVKGGSTGSTIGGGRWNSVESSSSGATIGGGWSNEASGDSATIGGGAANTASGWAATVGGGYANSATASNAVVAGGLDNTATGRSATVAGGFSNFAGSNSAAIGGGWGNEASNDYATVGGGLLNVASGPAATVAGGYVNSASDSNAVVAGGMQNIASGNSATVPGGLLNEASGHYSFAAGRQAKATNSGAFVWADSLSANLYSSGDNSVTMRASGGYLLRSSTTNSGVYLAPYANAWSTISDREAKKNIQPVDPRAVLEKLTQLPVPQWNYKFEPDDAVPHLGPMAQDFKAAFYPGRDEKGITTLEFDGVALAAIQGLNEKVESGKQKTETRMEQLEAELTLKERELTELKQRLEQLERLVNAWNGGSQ